MKKVFLFVLIQTFLPAGFAQNLPFQLGAPFQSADLDIHWNAPKNALPSKVWVYRLLPAKFSRQAVAKLMVMGSFSDKDETKHDPNDMLFKSADGSRCLQISFSSGIVNYMTMPHYSPTNLIEAVPGEKEILKLTKNLLPVFGIKFSDIEKKENSTEANLHFFAPEIMFFVKPTIISNTVFRGIRFRRAVDGASFVGNGAGGDCEIDFGDHGKICKISLSWRNLERDKSFPTATPEMIMKWIREGKAVQNMIPLNSGDINWPTVKGMTIRRAVPCYHAGDPPAGSDWLYPYVALDTTVDTGHGILGVEVDCPIIDEAKTSRAEPKRQPHSP